MTVCPRCQKPVYLVRCQDGQPRYITHTGRLSCPLEKRVGDFK